MGPKDRFGGSSGPDGLGSERRQGPMGPSAVALDAVSFTYAVPNNTNVQPDWILRDIRLDVQAGEFITLLGPSGCGKSTLLRLIAGFLRPTEGVVRIDGKPVEGPGPDRAMVAQQPTLYPWLTVLENVCLPLQVRGVSRKERVERGKEMLRLVGLTRAGHLLPHQLSGGMTQRLMLARALIQEPVVLLLDESLAALDALSRERLQSELLYLWRRTGATILMVTHDVEEATLLATRVFVMTAKPGRLQAEKSLPFGAAVAAADVPVDAIRKSPEFLEVRSYLRSLIVEHRLES